MSFRELRDFTELMRSLGYPRLISVENFRSPNFALVADALYWLIHRYQPHVRISDEINTEDDRVEFITRIVQIMAGRARVKLSAKRLYAADGRAVRELLKIARLLYKAKQANIALRASTNAKLKSAADSPKAKESKTGSPRKEAAAEEGDGAGEVVLPALQNTRKLANEITESGAKLYDLLQHEDGLRRKRENALRFLDATNSKLHNTTEHEYIESSIREIIVSQGENVAALEKQCADLEHDEKNLEKKIKKKKGDLERSEKRLKSLQAVRPAFMDDLEKLEAELKKNYDLYLERFRNLDYLELQLDMHNQEEKEKLNTAERNLKRMQERLQKQDEHLNRGTKAIESAYHSSKGGLEGRDRADGGRPSASYLKYRDGAGGGGGGPSNDRSKARVVGDITGGAHSSSDGSLSGSASHSGDSDSDSEGWGQVSLGASGGGSDSGSDSESVIDDALDDDGDLSVSDENDYVSEDSGSDGNF